MTRPSPLSEGAVLSPRFWRDLPYRARGLVTRRYTWAADDGQKITTREDWDTAWALEGPHTYRWWWVARWGKLPCGCTRNPITRRLLLYRMDCDIHMARFRRDRQEDQ